MVWTNINTFVTIVAIILAVIGFKDYLFPKQWRKKYIQDHNPTPVFNDEMNLRLEGQSIFVQPKIHIGDEKERQLLKNYFFDKVFVKGGKKEDGNVFCILGDSGMGKTAALVNLFVDYIQHYTKKSLPYDIWLYSLSDKNVFEKVNAIKNKGNSILLLDAVDENEDAQDDSRYDQFVKNLEQTYQDFAFVVTTCRPQFFGDESEVFDKTQVRRNGFLKCKQLHLAPFDDDQVREYLFNLYYHEPDKTLKEEAERIMEKCPQIAQRPLVLSFITELVNEKGRNYDNTLDIYDNIVKSLIRREVEKSSPDADEAMMRQWREVLSEVAGFMYQNKKLKITLNEYETILSEHNLKVPQEVVDKKTFRQRSLLTRTAEGFHFSHKSFYEYFMAYRFFFDYGEVRSLLDMDFALQLYDELYTAYDSGKGNEHFGIDAVPLDEVAHCLSKIGDGLKQIDRFSNAEEKYEKALEKYRQLEAITPEAYLLYVAWTLNDLAILHNDAGKHDKAEEEYEEALKIRCALASSAPEAYLPDVAKTLNILGCLHYKTGKHDKAEEEFEEALKKYRALPSSSSEAYLPDVATTLNNLGALHSDIGKHDKAEKEYEEALKIYRDLALSSSEVYLHDVAMTLNFLGVLHDVTGKHDKAEEEYWEALKTYRALASSYPKTYLFYVAGTLNNLAIFHKNIGKLEKAEEEYEEALETYRALPSSSLEAYPFYVATTLSNLGVLHYETGKHEKSEEEYREALETFRALPLSNPEASLPYVAGTLLNIAHLRIKQDNLDDAEKLAQESLEKYEIMAKLSPAAFAPYVEKAKFLLELIQKMRNS